MDFEEKELDTHANMKTFLAPRTGYYQFGMSLYYTNTIKLKIWTNKAKMKGLKLTNKNLKRLYHQCTEEYTENYTKKVKLNTPITPEFTIPEGVLKRIGL